MARKKKETQRPKPGDPSFKEMKCNYCPNIVPKVDINATGVICWECVMKQRV